jgi:anti-anti-sigma regulatory factor
VVWIIGTLVLDRHAAVAENVRRPVASTGGRRDLPYDIRVRSHGDRLVVAVVGDVDVLAWRDLELMADAVAIADLDVDLDFGPLDFLDAHGVTALAALVERLVDEGRRVRIMHVPDHARRIIDLVAPALRRHVVDERSSAEQDRK